MSDRDKCKLIIKKMRELGVEEGEESMVDSWLDCEVEYFVANYEEPYLGVEVLCIP